ncbi:MAG: 3-dehydroquinate synthase [Treponema sp.]|nr:3-dehydroquinate synthase [Treponema sp.]
MQYEEKIIQYPPVHPGTDRTFIRFYSGAIDLNALFYAAGTTGEDAKTRPMRIFVTDDTVASLPALHPFVTLFHDRDGGKNLKPGFVGERGKDILIILASGESAKTIESVLSIIAAALDYNAQRSAVFVGIGGGVITDMTAFAASIFKRGAHCELIPTTLLSMVDAAIGGKTGCDFKSYKNMIGSFFPAQKIHICPAFVQSLPQDQYRSGLAEAVKTALLYDEKLIEKLEATPEVLTDRTLPLVEEMIQICVSAKAAVVEQDLTEKNIRMQLNLGHTFGHALETIAGLGTVSHGDAVAWGISRAATLAEQLGLCHSDFEDRVKRLLKSFGWETGPLHSAIAGRFTDEAEAARALYAAMKKDKKNAGSEVRFVLQRGPCDTVITEVSERDVLSALTHE